MMRNSHNSPGRSTNLQHSKKHHTTRSEVQWVTPFTEAALHPFSSAVQFVSTTLRPLTEPSIAYPSGPSPNHLSRANGLLSSSSRLNSLQSVISLSHPTSHNGNGGLKRSRTTTSSSISASISRKRSKSDVGLNDRNRPRLGPADMNTPALLLRQKQRLSEGPSDKLNRKKNFHTSPYPHYINAATRSTTSLKSNSSVTSMSTLYPTRVRADSQLSTKSSRLNEEIRQTGPVRATYLGGVGVYLSHDPVNEESIQEEKDSLYRDKVGDSHTKPNLTIDVGLSNNGPELLKNVGSWYNRLLLSPLSTASSSVLSFLVSSTTASTSSDDPDAINSQDGISEDESENSSIPSKVNRRRSRR